LGRGFSSCVTAVKPPAEAPIPITGNEEVSLVFVERLATEAFGWTGPALILFADLGDFATHIQARFEAGLVQRFGITKCLSFETGRKMFFDILLSRSKQITALIFARPRVGSTTDRFFLVSWAGIKTS